MATSRLRFACILVLLCLPLFLGAKEEVCKPSGTVEGTDPSVDTLPEEEGNNGLCKFRHKYKLYNCSPPVSSHTSAILHETYNETDMFAILSTGWFANKTRLGKRIKITVPVNGKSAMATVVDECDSAHGCDPYFPPCDNNIVIASSAVWKALGIDTPGLGRLNITWSHA